jgi:UPF0755 protein
LEYFRSHHTGSRQFPTGKFVAAAVIFLAIVFFAFDFYQFQKSLKIVPSADSRVFPFEISSAEKVSEFAARLETENFVSSARNFIRFARGENLDRQFRAGRFFLPKNLTIPEIVAKLTSTEIKTFKITIPEGFSVEQIDARLARAGLISAGEFQSCVFESCDFSDFKFLPAKNGEILRGFFWPDTFFIDPSEFSAESFAHRLLKNFAAKMRAEFPEKLNENFAAEVRRKTRSILEIVKMASILEKETKNKTNRPLVADLFWRRLDAKIPLGADATVRFAVGKKTAAITVDDLNSDSEFNTRKFAGLTPTAICNPGRESLRATIFPKKNNFWYFLHDSNGEIHFAETLEKHARNKLEFLK